MKKILIASTALVAAGLMAPATASAAEKIKLQVGGYSKWWVVAKWNDSNHEGAGNGTGTNYNNVDVIGDNEIHFIGSTTLDNGLKVGIQVELEAGGHTDQTQDTIDASFVFVEGGWGKVMLGTANNGTYLLHVMAPDAAGNWGEGGLIQSAVAVNQPTNVLGMPYLSAANTATMSRAGNTTNIVVDNKAEKITYVAPSFYGLTLGGSYIPNLIEDTRAVTSGATQAWGVGGLYANTFSGVGVKVSGGFVRYDVNPADANSKATDYGFEWSTGTQLSYAGFTLGGSYKKSNSNFGVCGNAANCNIALAQDSTLSQNGHAYDVGLQYASGPYAVSFAYFASRVDGTRSVEGQDKIDIYQVSGKYTLGPGVDVLASVGYAKYRDEAGGPAANAGDGNQNDGWAVMTGLSLSF